MNRLRLLQSVISGLENFITILAVTAIVAFCGWLVLGVSR